MERQEEEKEGEKGRVQKKEKKGQKEKEGRKDLAGDQRGREEGPPLEKPGG